VWGGNEGNSSRDLSKLPKTWKEPPKTDPDDWDSLSSLTSAASVSAASIALEISVCLVMAPLPVVHAAGAYTAIAGEYLIVHSVYVYAIELA